MIRMVRESIMKTPMALGTKENLMHKAMKSIMKTPMAIGAKVNMMHKAT